MKRWLQRVGVVGVMLMGLAVPGVQAASKTMYVGTCKGPSLYATVQSAVDAATASGYTIYVCPGTYNESVQVQNKDDLTIRNYVVKNQPAPLIDAGGNDGFDVRESKEVEIRGLRITNASTAVFAINSRETEVRNTLITNASSAGIYFYRSDKSEAQLNTISGSGNYGIVSGNSNNVTVKHNTISSLQTGIYVVGNDKSKIESNSVTNVDGTGIYLHQTTRANVRKNTTNFTSFGSILQDSNANTISENTAKNNSQAGVYVTSDSTNNTFKKNLLQGNGTDAYDKSTGSKTAGTANSWSSNKCDISMPSDLCGSLATQRRAPPTPPAPPTLPKH